MEISKQRVAVFAGGFFALGLVPMMTVAVPLWAIEIGATPFMIGLVLGSRAALSAILSIPGGALMDRLGINPITAAAALVATIAFPLYAYLPWVGALICLQLLTGFAQGLLWMGAQAQVSRLRQDDPALMGRFTFISTIGNLAGPLLCGTAWDIWGAQGAFLVIGLWSAGALVTVAFQPRGVVPSAATTKSARSLRPRFSDYADAIRMIGTPAIGFVIACSFLMTTTHALRHSFYPVYLESLGMTGTLIGMLVATGSVVAGLSGLTAGFATRRIDPNILLIVAVALTTVCISLVVQFEAFWSLFGMAVFWGAVAGIAFPLMLYVLARSVGPERQGMSIGVRTTVNRMAGVIVPITMGAVVDWIGLQAGFYVFGICVLAALGMVAVRLLPRTRATG